MWGRQELGPKYVGLWVWGQHRSCNRSSESAPQLTKPKASLATAQQCIGSLCGFLSELTASNLVKRDEKILVEKEMIRMTHLSQRQESMGADMRQGQ